jgi:hypothetical protein
MNPNYKYFTIIIIIISLFFISININSVTDCKIHSIFTPQTNSPINDLDLRNIFNNKYSNELDNIFQYSKNINLVNLNKNQITVISQFKIKANDNKDIESDVTDIISSANNDIATIYNINQADLSIKCVKGFTNFEYYFLLFVIFGTLILIRIGSFLAKK